MTFGRGPNVTVRDRGVNAHLNVLNVKVVVAACNQEKALVGAFSVITNVWMDLFEALLATVSTRAVFCCGCVLTPQLPCSACWLQPVNHLQ